MIIMVIIAIAVAVVMAVVTIIRNNLAVTTAPAVVTAGAEQIYDPHLISCFYKTPEYKAMAERVISTVKHYTYYDDFNEDESLDYKFHRLPIANRAIHVGQLKLLLTEIEFLTHQLDKKDDPGFFIYAGSAPCHHLYTLMQMFPKIKFLLVDPNPHVIKSGNRVSHLDPESKWAAQVLYFRIGMSKATDIKDPICSLWNFQNKAPNSLERNSPEALGRNSGDPPEKASGNISENGVFSGSPEMCKKVIDTIIDLYESEYRVFIVEDYFTAELAKAASIIKSKPVYFCSDIRTRLNEQASNPSDLDILWNSAQQAIWLNHMKPRAFMLKFRPPYMLRDFDYGSISENIKSDFDLARSICGIDFIQNYKNGKFEYFKNDAIYLQAFPGKISSESRLIGTTLDSQSYDPKKWENHYTYYNKFVRKAMFYPNHYYFDQKTGMDGCADCDLMIRIFSDYFKKFETEDRAKTREAIFDALDAMERNLYLSDYSHGKFIKSIKDYDEFVSDQNYFKGWVIDSSVVEKY